MVQSDVGSRFFSHDYLQMVIFPRELDEIIEMDLEYMKRTVNYFEKVLIKELSDTVR